MGLEPSSTRILNVASVRWLLGNQCSAKGKMIAKKYFAASVFILLLVLIVPNARHTSPSKSSNSTESYANFTKTCNSNAKSVTNPTDTANTRTTCPSAWPTLSKAYPVCIKNVRHGFVVVGKWESICLRSAWRYISIVMCVRRWWLGVSRKNITAEASCWSKSNSFSVRSKRVISFVSFWQRHS